jgi:hypothetical protein
VLQVEESRKRGWILGILSNVRPMSLEEYVELYLHYPTPVHGVRANFTTCLSRYRSQAGGVTIVRTRTVIRRATPALLVVRDVEFQMS